MLYEVAPLDSVYFGRGVPFSAGFETVGKGVFPPPPSVFYGAFATYYLSLKGMSPENINFIKKSLRIKGLYYKMDNGFFITVPMDLVKSEMETENKVSPLKMFKPIVETDLNDGPENLLYAMDRVENVKGLMDDKAMSSYLKGGIDSIPYIPFKDIVKTEDKIGISIDNSSNSSKEEYLYKINYTRMAKDVKNFLNFVVDVECGDFMFPDKGLLRLGGEGKAASVRKLSGIPEFLSKTLIDEVKKIIRETRKFKLVLVTSAIFKNGWKPDFSDLNVRVKLIAAAVGKPVSIGGWDMEAQKPKVMSKAVPAGSVYYYEILDGAVDGLMEKIYENGVSDSRTSEGFGVSLIGGLHDND